MLAVPASSFDRLFLTKNKRPLTAKLDVPYYFGDPAMKFLVGILLFIGCVSANYCGYSDYVVDIL